MKHSLPLLLLLVAVASNSTSCQAPDPQPEPELPAQTTPLAQRLRSIAARTSIVVGHRGANATHPENTVVAFEAALDAGADMIELDFRQTADGILICMHDRTIDRTTDGARRFGRDDVAVGSRTAAELASLDAGSWKGPEHANARVPTLSQALDTIQPRCVTMIEHKDGDAEKLVSLLRDKGLIDDVLVQSFDWEWLAAVRELEPRLTLGALGSRVLSPDRLAEIDQLGVSMVHWAVNDLTLDNIGALHARGYLVTVYTVNADLGLVGCLQSGIDAVTTDVPARLRELADGFPDLPGMR